MLTNPITIPGGEVVTDCLDQKLIRESLSVPDTKLYMAPGTCARVPAVALEEADEPFDAVLIRFMKGEHKDPQYKQLNPKGKVPTLVIDGRALTENVAIISYLNQRFPDARLLPPTSDPLDQARQIADLSFCASTLHPIVTRIRIPVFFAPEEAAQSVWKKGCEAMTEYFRLINERLSDQPWWYGDDWSIVDTYLYWVFWRVKGAEFDVTPYPHYCDHADRTEQRPTMQRVLEREYELQSQLESEGLTFTLAPMNKK